MTAIKSIAFCVGWIVASKLGLCWVIAYYIIIAIITTAWVVKVEK